MTYRLVNGTAFLAGTLLDDTSGAGTGPWILTYVLVDPTGQHALNINSDGSINTALPAGAATTALQGIGNTFLQAIDSNTTTISVNTGTTSTAVEALAACVQTAGLLYTFTYGAAAMGGTYPADFFVGATGGLALNIGGTGQGWTGSNPSGATYAGQVDGAVFNYSNITGDATTTVKSGTGALHAITFNAPAATEVVTLWDSLTATGTKIGTITIPASPQPFTLHYDVTFSTGLTIVTGTATSDITVSFR